MVRIYGKELYHYGINGQRWGLRRFQNEDGTYTEEGKLRKRKYSEDYIKAKPLKGRSVKELSNKEIRDYNERTRLEREYNNLNPSIIKNGLQIANNITAGITTVIALSAAISKGKSLVKELISK